MLFIVCQQTIVLYGGANMIRRSKGMLPSVPFRPFHRIAFNFCNITNASFAFRDAAGVGRLAADAEDRNSKNRRRRRRLFKTFVVQDVITNAVLSPDIIDAAPSNRSKKKPQPTPRHCRLTGLNHALTYSNLAFYLLALQKKLRRSPCTGPQVGEQFWTTRTSSK